MPTCDPISSAALAGDKLRSTQEIATSPKRIEPLFKTRRRGNWRASSIALPARGYRKHPSLRLSTVTNAEGPAAAAADFFTISLIISVHFSECRFARRYNFETRPRPAAALLGT